MAQKKKVVILGSGNVGQLVCALLADRNENYAVTLVDGNHQALAKTAEKVLKEKEKNVNLQVANFDTAGDLERVLHGQDYVMSCAPFHCNIEIAKIAKKTKVHYLDLTEDVQTTKSIQDIARDAQTAFIPQCGLAPGFVSVVTQHLIKQFEEVQTAGIRVGALPLYPTNRLKYNLTWSTEGLINQYCNPCEVITQGVLKTVPALEGEETFRLAGEHYEAFYTSGGLGTLAQSLQGRVMQLDYKTIRYPGHREIFSILLQDLKFEKDRTILKQILERSIPRTQQDFVLIFISICGKKEGEFVQESYVKKIKHGFINNVHWGAIQIATASSICTVLDLHAYGSCLPKCGFIKQEEIPLSPFLKNPLSVCYHN